MSIIRSDKLSIQAHGAQRDALAATLAAYRRLVRDLMGVINTHWPALGGYRDNEIVAAVEALVHPTSKRPGVRYPLFARRHHKFPSYYRRVAIMDAAGQVRSFHTRYNQWLDGRRKHPHANPPHA